MRFVCDSTWRWVGDAAVLAGSPHRLFRLTPAGVAVARRIEAGDDVATSRLVERLLDAGAIHPAPLHHTNRPLVSAAAVTVVTPQLGGRVADDDRITVDDGSDPPLAGASIRLDPNVGPGGARNAGRAEVAGGFVCFLDADVDVAELDAGHPDHDRWWRSILRHFDDPRVGLVAPRVLGDDGSSLDLGAEPGRIRAGTRLSYAPGAALVVRVDAFDDVGGFDASLRIGEDVDFVWRLDQAGWWCRYEPAASVRHRPRPTAWEQLRQQTKYGSSSGALALRHPGELAPWRAGGWTAATWASVLLGRPAVGALIAAASVARLSTADSGLDPGAAVRVAISGHASAGRQLPIAIRRAWWPLLVPFLWSRRVRWVVGAALVADPRRVAKDLAFSVGLWRSSIAVQDLGAVWPRLTLGRPSSSR